jgi:hypothetical protein
MTGRQRILSYVAGAILKLPAASVVRVGIDGVDGAGKTVFADELARVIETHGRSVIRASVDSFHNPRSRRYRLGRGSPEGFYLDSYDYTRLKELLLDPLSRGGTGYYRSAAFDHATDSEVSMPEQQAVPSSILSSTVSSCIVRNCGAIGTFPSSLMSTSLFPSHGARPVGRGHRIPLRLRIAATSKGRRSTCTNVTLEAVLL